MQVFDEERSDILATAIRHKTRIGDFAHIRVDERNAGAPFLPNRKQPLVIPPTFIDFLFRTAFLENQIAVFLCHQAEKIAPQQFKKDPVSRFIFSPLFLVTLQLVVDKFGRNTALRQPRREFCGIIFAEQTVAGIEVIGNGVGLPQVMLQAGECRRFAAFKVNSGAGFEVGLFQTEVLDRGNITRVGHLGGSFQIDRHGQRFAYFDILFYLFSEVRKNVGRVRHRERQIGGVVQHFTARVAHFLPDAPQFFFEGVLNIDFLLRALAVAKNPTRFIFARQIEENIFGFAAAHD